MTAPEPTPAESFAAEFRFDRWPILTISVMALFVATYFGWQRDSAGAADELARLGAKNLALMVERGEWWRLISANLLHATRWHLFVNLLFLFNLGGPAEAAFRRLDYALLLVGSGLATTLVSTLLGASTSCGASGMVFGVWAALAIFGLRHRKLLPGRYRRYFLGSVIPYAALAFLVSQRTPGADVWGHAGGVAAGLVAGLVFPARLLAPDDRRRPLKIAALLTVPLLVAALSTLAPGSGPALAARPIQIQGLRLQVPQRWRQTLERREPRRHTVLFDNGGGVTLGVTAERLARATPLATVVDQFVTEELDTQLAANAMARTSDRSPELATLHGLATARLHVEAESDNYRAHAVFVLLTEAGWEYVLSFTSPAWLAADYAAIRDTILSSLTIATDSGRAPGAAGRP
ncbi:MAG: rhomboid family intramembrane serine protease [Deltaproteobacteria bacterium]|nr:rhomboid family intramembrane serine protease [Deltaproteobacteria bacterium]